METWVSTYTERMKRKNAWLERGARHREEWSGKTEHRSNQACEKSIEIGDRMEIGQPILVGHHNEKWHRRDICKLEREGRTDSRSHTEAQESSRVGKPNEMKSVPISSHRLRDAKAKTYPTFQPLNGYSPTSTEGQS